MRALRARTDQRPGGPECRHSGSVTSVAHRHCISPVPRPRQTKKEQKKLPTKFYIGTVADTPGDSRGDRLTKKERKRTIAHSLLADEKFQYVSVTVASRHLAALFVPWFAPDAPHVFLCRHSLCSPSHRRALWSVPRGDNLALTLCAYCCALVTPGSTARRTSWKWSDARVAPAERPTRRPRRLGRRPSSERSD